MLKGKLVELRPVQRADISYFLQWFNDPDVTQYLLMYMPMTEMTEQKFIEDFSIRRRGQMPFLLLKQLTVKIVAPLAALIYIISILKTMLPLLASPSGIKNTGVKVTAPKLPVDYPVRF